MSWVITSIGVGAGMNFLNAQEQRKQKKQELLANAAQIQYSPWTGMKADTEGMGGVQNPFTAAVGGGMQGGLTASMMKSQFGTPAAPAQAAQSAPEATNGGLGSTDYARQLGQQADQFQASMPQAYQAPMAPQFAQLQKPNLYNPRG